MTDYKNYPDITKDKFYLGSFLNSSNVAAAQHCNEVAKFSIVECS